MKNILYRPEIDGMRAVAIASVLIYHLNKNWLNGGFLGVDVFFVISGYLITSKIMKGIETGNFSMVAFLKGRFLRLMPALLVMLSFTVLTGAIILEKGERSALLAQAIAGGLSVENIFLWVTTSGYWSDSVEQLPLLHLWSLSLEEQFYLFFPLTLLLARHSKQRKQIVVMLFLCSLILSLLYTDVDPSGAFFLLPSRMWELLMGAIVAVFGTKLRALKYFTKPFESIVSFIGLVLILVSLVTIKKGDDFPGIVPLGCCLGTSFILICDKNVWVNKTLKFGPIVYLGKLSYSLYLWHWPVIVFSKFIYPEQPYLWLVILSVTLAVLSYHLVECPLRYNGIKSRKVRIFLLSLLALSFIPLGALKTPLINSKVEWDAENPLVYGEMFDAHSSLSNFGKALVINKSTKMNEEVCMLGSSHARVYCAPLLDFAREHDIYLTSLSSAGASLVKNVNLPPDLLMKEAQLNLYRKNYIRSKQFKLIIVADIWTSQTLNSDFRENLLEWLLLLSRQSERVIVLGQPPLIELPQSYRGALKKYVRAVSARGENLTLKPSPKWREDEGEVEMLIARANLENVKFIELGSLFVNKQGCIALYLDGSTLYADPNHLSEKGARLCFQRKLYDELKKIMFEPALK